MTIKCTLNIFPDELLCVFFSKLNTNNLSLCCRVSTRWNVLASSNDVWLPIAQYRIIHPATWNELAAISHLHRISATCQLKFMCHLLPQYPQSNEEILRCAEKFLQKVSQKDNARFTCVLGTGCNYRSITILFKDRRNPSNRLTIQQDCCAPQEILNNGTIHQEIVSQLKKEENSVLFAGYFICDSAMIQDDFKRFCYRSYHYSTQLFPFEATILYPHGNYQTLEDCISSLVYNRLTHLMNALQR